MAGGLRSGDAERLPHRRHPGPFASATQPGGRGRGPLEGGQTAGMEPIGKRSSPASCRVTPKRRGRPRRSSETGSRPTTPCGRPSSGRRSRCAIPGPRRPARRVAAHGRHREGGRKPRAPTAAGSNGIRNQPAYPAEIQTLDPCEFRRLPAQACFDDPLAGPLCRVAGLADGAPGRKGCPTSE